MSVDNELHMMLILRLSYKISNWSIFAGISVRFLVCCLRHILCLFPVACILKMEMDKFVLFSFSLGLMKLEFLTLACYGLKRKKLWFA